MEISAELLLQPDARRYTLGRFLEDVTQRHGDARALHFAGEDWSYTRLEREVRAFARGLVGVGAGKGTRVAILLSNRPEWVVACFGAGLVGAVPVPVNTFGTAFEIDGILRHSDASLLVMQRDLLRHRYLEDLVSRHAEIAEADPGRIRCPALPSLRQIFTLGEAPAEGGVQRWEDLIAAGSDVSDPLLSDLAGAVEPVDDGLLIYTSGTTAQPKGVLHRQRAPVIQSWRFAEHYDLVPEDVVFSAQPFFWTAGICMSLGATLAAGGTLLLQETFEPGAALAAIERHRATVVHAWPHQEKAMAEHASAVRCDLSSVTKLNASSPLARRCGIAGDAWGTSGYGLSETFTLAAAVPARSEARLRHETAGFPLPGMRIKIVDPADGTPRPLGEKGEIAVQGLTLMRGYHKIEPERTFDDDGFFHTQDAGWLDAEGALHWEGRLSNLIKTGGANVSPREIEAALAPMTGLYSAHAVGVPHPSLGEIVVLCAVASGEGDPPEAETLRAHLRSQLAAYKVPRCVLFFTRGDLELTGSQKIQTAPLRARAIARLAEQGTEVDGYRYGAADLGA